MENRTPIVPASLCRAAAAAVTVFCFYLIWYALDKLETSLALASRV